MRTSQTLSPIYTRYQRVPSLALLATTLTPTEEETSFQKAAVSLISPGLSLRRHGGSLRVLCNALGLY
jgi:hypothetical protein